jgi:hypothetical protein
MAKAKKSAKDQLAAGAKEIKDAQKELTKGKAQAAKPETVVIPESTRPMEEIIRDHVTIAPGSIGLTLSDDIPMEESLRVLDWTTQLSEHVGFMIGDVLNSGQVRWGEKYTAVLNQTGRALSTLKGYAEVARRIPIDKRVKALSFSHHREMIRLPDEKMGKVLEDLEKESEKKDGEIPTRDELRRKIQTLTPRKKKRATSGKGKKKGKKAPDLPPYEPTDAEQELLEEGEMAIDETAKLLKPDGKLFKVLVRLDNKEKQRWLSKLDPIVLFFKGVQNTTGY